MRGCTANWVRITSSLLITPAMAFSTSSPEKHRFRAARFFDGLQQPKMTVHPHTVCSQSKNGVFNRLLIFC